MKKDEIHQPNSWKEKRIKLRSIERFKEIKERRETRKED